MSTIIVTVLVLLLSVVVWYLSAVPRLYKEAKSTGLPVYFSLISPSNTLWLIAGSVVGYSTLSRLIPGFLFDRIRYTILGWSFRYQPDANSSLGNTFVLCSPGSNSIYISDPDMAQAVLMRRKDFGRPENSKSMSLNGDSALKTG
jgi:hypothetical protein